MMLCKGCWCLQVRESLLVQPKVHLIEDLYFYLITDWLGLLSGLKR
jgi:hypothetical protein